ncbi:MAG: PilZ domain-containing protein [Planctomycetes bacterium]|nr:PilZ domain-containing protein [Planctomycetota bacterium]
MEGAFPFDAREFVRVSARVPVSFRLLEDGQASGPTREGVTENLSAGGLLIHARFPEEEVLARAVQGRSALAFQFSLPEDESEAIRGVGRLVWVEAVPGEAGSCRMGVRFRELLARDRDRIIAFVVRAIV